MKRSGFLERRTPMKRTAFKRKPGKPLKRSGFLKRSTKSMKACAKKIKKELDDLVKSIAKVRDQFTCQKCGERVEGSNCHGSHVIPVSAGNKLRWDEQNVKVLCYHHHMNWWHKHPLEAAAWFKERFPERAAYLEANQGIAKFYTADLIELRDKLKKRLSDLLGGTDQ